MTQKKFYESKGKIGALLLIAAGALTFVATGEVNTESVSLVLSGLAFFGIRDAQK